MKTSEKFPAEGEGLSEKYRLSDIDDNYREKLGQYSFEEMDGSLQHESGYEVKIVGNDAIITNREGKVCDHLARELGIVLKAERGYPIRK